MFKQIAEVFQNIFSKNNVDLRTAIAHNNAS